MDAKTYLESHWMKKQVWTRLQVPMHQERLRKCAEAVGGGKKFVDVGCGLGHSTAIMKGFCPGDWTGIDFGESAVIEARKLFPDIRFLYCLRTADIPEGGWDGVVCSEVIEHVEDPADFVGTLLNITAAGGVLALTTPNRPVSDPGHVRVYTRPMLEELFDGFPGTVEIKSEGRFWYVTARREG